LFIVVAGCASFGAEGPSGFAFLEVARLPDNIFAAVGTCVHAHTTSMAPFILSEALSRAKRIRDVVPFVPTVVIKIAIGKRFATVSTRMFHVLILGKSCRVSFFFVSNPTLPV
jgi:hypothetical protein